MASAFVSAPEVRKIRQVFSFSKSTLARCLDVSVNTISRWENGSNIPTGLHQSVLDALYSVAAEVAPDKARIHLIRARILLGVGPMVFHTLNDLHPS